MKQKINEIKEKGKEWIKKNKFYIGWVAGGACTVLFAYLHDKIFEPKDMSLNVSYNTDIENENFCIRVAGRDRFGNCTYYSPWVRYEQNAIKSKELINETIGEAMNKSFE